MMCLYRLYRNHHCCTTWAAIVALLPVQVVQE